MSERIEYKYDVFISYSHLDQDWVRNWLLPRLEAAHLRICIDYLNFEFGLPLLENIEKAVENSYRTLIVLTPEWVESDWAIIESLLAQTPKKSEHTRHMIPLLLKSCDFPPRIKMLYYADFRNQTEWESATERLIPYIRQTKKLELKLCDREQAKRQAMGMEPPNAVYLQAPVGFGKTYLLDEIEREYKTDGNWLIVRFDFKIETKRADFFQLVEALCEKTGVSEKAGDQIEYIVLMTKQVRKLGKKLLLIIDHIDEADDKVIEWLHRDLIEFLKIQFKRSHSDYRVILAGRRSGRQWSNAKKTRTLDTIYLHSLSDPENMNQFLQIDVPDLAEDQRKGVADYLTYITHGHPSGLASVINDLKQFQLEGWQDRLKNETYRHDLFCQHMTPILNNILEEIRNRPYLLWVLRLSFLRSFNSNLLSVVNQAHSVNEENHEHDLDYCDVIDELYESCTIIESFENIVDHPTYSKLDLRGWYRIQDMVRHLVQLQWKLFQTGFNIPSSGLLADLAKQQPSDLYEISMNFHEQQLQVSHILLPPEFIHHVTESLYYQLKLLDSEQIKAPEKYNRLAGLLAKQINEIPPGFERYYKEGGSTPKGIERRFCDALELLGEHLEGDHDLNRYANQLFRATIQNRIDRLD